MAGRVRWLGVGMVVCFVLLFLQLNNIQVKNAHAYATNSSNPAVVEAKYDQPRGIIQSADGVVLAQSVRTSRGAYKYIRQYPTGPLFAQIAGYLPIGGLPTGVEATYGQYLAQHNRPVKTIADLLTTPVETDTVTLTLSSKLQETARQALAGRDGAIVALDPTTGAILAMYSNPTFDPNPLALNNATRVADAYRSDTTKNPVTGFAPAVSLAYQDSFQPGSTFKVVTATAAYEYTPKLVDTPMPSYVCIPVGTLGGQGVPLCNDGMTSCGGTISVMLPESCDPGFALLGTRVRRGGHDGRGPILWLQPTATSRPAHQHLPALALPDGAPCRLHGPDPAGLRVDRPGLHRGDTAADGARGGGDRQRRRGDDPPRHV